MPKKTKSEENCLTAAAPEHSKMGRLPSQLRSVTATSLVLAGAFLGGCSTIEIQPLTVAPLEYEKLTCEDITSRYKNISWRVFVLTGYRQPENNAAEIKIIWPPANIYNSNLPLLAELQRLKGEAEALITTGIGKRCPTILWHETSPEFSLTAAPLTAPPPTDAAGAPPPEAP